jgi:tetratricopeptide (TPR) repeat protein
MNCPPAGDDLPLIHRFLIFCFCSGMILFGCLQARAESEADVRPDRLDQTARKIVLILASARIEQAKPAEAEAILRRHLQNDRDHAEAWNLRGLAALRSKEPQKATRHFLEAIRLTKNQENHHYFKNLAHSYFQSGDEKKGRLARKKGESIAPSTQSYVSTIRSLDQEKLKPISLRSKYHLSATLGYDSNIGYLPDNRALVPQIDKADSLYSALSVAAEWISRRDNRHSLLKSDVQWVAIDNDQLKSRGLLSLRLHAENGLATPGRDDFFHESYLSLMATAAPEVDMAHRASIAQLGVRLGYSESIMDSYLHLAIRRDFFPSYRGHSLSPTGFSLDAGPGVRARLGTTSVNAELLIGSNQSEGESYRHVSIKAPLKAVLRASERLQLGSGFLFSYAAFLNSDVLRDRIENRLSLFSNYRLTPDLMFGVQLEQSISQSDQRYFSYKRQAASCSLRYGF